MGRNNIEFISHEDFGIFAAYDRVVVTGPQRSGTKFVAYVIHRKTGYPLVLHWMMPPTDEGVAKFNASNNIILHQPSYVAVLESVNNPGTAVVFVWRNLEDIYRSEKKWGWDQHYVELGLLGVKEGDPAALKQRLWVQKLAESNQNFFTVGYESLSSNPLWVNKKDREKFVDINQISANGLIMA